MSEEVKKRVDEYCKKQESLYKTEKDNDLIERGLYDLLESLTPKEGYYYSEKYLKYIKKVPLDVSDEDYERIKKYKVSSKSNHLCVLGVLVIIFGIVIGIVSIAINPVLCFLIWFLTMLISVIYFSLHKIINLIDK